eukprot:Skav217161  [mRNA]  locus=scaffold566:114505:123659:+ [translate_table: standard]
MRQRLLQLWFLTGCLRAVRAIEPLHSHDESCSMQSYHSLGETKLPDSSVSSKLLDTLILKAKSHKPRTEPLRSERPSNAYVEAITNRSAAFKPVNNTNSTSHGLGNLFHNVHSFFHERPEMKALLKAVLVSWAVAGWVGACAVACGKAKIYPPYKYLSWRDIKEEEAAVVGSGMRFWANLDPTTKWSLLSVFIFFLVIFMLLWKMGVIQPVINQLTCYIYVFLFFGVVISVIVTDVLSKVKKQAQESLAPVLRFLDKIEGHPLLPEDLNLKEANKESVPTRTTSQ